MIGAILHRKYIDFVFEYNSPAVALFSLSFYYIAKSMLIKKQFEKSATLLWKIDRLCFGAYLVHPVFIQSVYRVVKITPCSFDWYPVFTILFFVAFLLCSFAASAVLYAIPPMRKYVL